MILTFNISKEKIEVDFVTENEAEILNEGIALRKDGIADRALLKFQEVLSLNPKNAAAYREKAITLQIMGEKDRAMAAYKKALELDPSSSLRKGTVPKRGRGKIASGLLVSDIMVKDLVSVSLDATAKDASELMNDKNISSVAVKEDGKVIGIVTERDFVRNYQSISGKDFADVPIKDLVAFPLIAVPVDTTLEEASIYMLEKNIRHLLVREGTDIVGLFSLRDILKTFSKQL